jgi:prepilin-type processing-associated H-X9-DG protein
MIAISDSAAVGFYDHLIRPTAGIAYSTPGRIHRGGANVLFCDGHVQWHPQQDLIFDPNNAADRKRERAWKWRWWDYDHGWRYDGLGFN